MECLDTGSFGLVCWKWLAERQAEWRLREMVFPSYSGGPPQTRIRWGVFLLIAVPGIYTGMIIYPFSRRLLGKWLDFVNDMLLKYAVKH